MSRRLRIAVTGPTGAGKSTFAGRLASLIGAALVREKVDTIQAARFDLNPAANCFNLQRAIISERIASNQRIPRACRFVVMDRIVAEDVAIFLPMYLRAGLLTKHQVTRILSTIPTELDFQPVHLQIHLHANHNILNSRLRASGSPGPVIALLNSQILRYSEWIETRSNTVISIDTSSISVRDLEYMAITIAGRIGRAPQVEAPISISQISSCK